MKNSLTIVLSSILFVIGCFLFKPYYNMGREGCSGFVSVIFTAVIAIPLFFFTVMVLLTALYRFIRYRQWIDLLPFAVMAVLLLAAKGIDVYKYIQDKEAIKAVSNFEGITQARISFRKNGTYTANINGADVGCSWSGEYVRHNDTIFIDGVHLFVDDTLIYPTYIQHDATLKPAANVNDTAHWLFVDICG